VVKEIVRATTTDASRRPLAVCLIFYVAGLSLEAWLHWPWPGLFVVASLATLGACFLRSPHNAACLILALAATGATQLALQRSPSSPHDLRRRVGDEAQIVTVRGELLRTPEFAAATTVPRRRARTRAELRVTALATHGLWQPALGQILVSTPHALEDHFYRGVWVEITGTIRRPPRALAEGLFDYRRHLETLGIHYVLQADHPSDWRRLIPPDLSESRPWEDRFQAWARQALRYDLPHEDTALRLLWAMVLGWKPALTDEVSEPFVRSGTLHVFAISGLHVALICSILVAVLRASHLPRPHCALVVIPLLWAYTFATGCSASAVRSAVMMTVILAGWILRRPPDLLNSLAGAAWIILLFDPCQLFQTGFQLSFVVVLALALSAERWPHLAATLAQSDPLLPESLRRPAQRALRAFRHYLGQALLTSLVAWLASLPLIARDFHLFTPVSLIANVVVVPLSSAALAASLGSLLTAAWLPIGSACFNHSAWLWMQGMIGASQWTAQLPGAYTFVRAPGPIAMIGYYALLLLWLVPRQQRSIRLDLALSLLLALTTTIAYLLPSATRATHLTVLPLGGAGIWVDAPGDSSDLLVDCGDVSAMAALTKPFLQAQGRADLPRVVLTHGDAQHVAGLPAFWPDFTIDELITSNVPFRSPVYRRVLNALRPPHAPRTRRNVHAGDTIGQWTVLHPPSDRSWTQADDAAVVLLGTFMNTRVLLISDLGRLGQRWLTEHAPDLRADLVVTGFPAQGEALSESLLHAIQPQAVILAGAVSPASARPSRSLIERLNTAEIPFVSTDIFGTAQITIHSSGWLLRTQHGPILAGSPIHAALSTPATH
jgi:competence protein ComEC